MLFGKKSRKRDLKIFRIPEEDAPEGNKIPLRLVVGLLAPFVIVAVFLLVFARKIDLKSSVLKPGIPQGTLPPSVAVVSPTPSMEAVEPSAPIIAKQVNPPAPVPMPIAPKPLLHENKTIKATPAPLSTGHIKDAGEKTTPSDLKKLGHVTASIKSVAGLKPAELKPTGKKPDQKFTFFKTLKDSPTTPAKKVVPIEKSAGVLTPKKETNEEKPVSISPIAPPHTDVKSVAGLKPTEKKVTPVVAVAAPVPIAGGGTPPTDVTAPKTTTVVPVVPAIGRFTIQVGSFAKKEDADRLALKLNDHGHPAYVVMANIVDKGVWYRVRVGKYKDRPSALDAGEKISKGEQISFIITSDP